MIPRRTGGSGGHFDEPGGRGGRFPSLSGRAEVRAGALSLCSSRRRSGEGGQEGAAPLSNRTRASASISANTQDGCSSSVNGGDGFGTPRVQAPSLDQKRLRMGTPRNAASPAAVFALTRTTPRSLMASGFTSFGAGVSGVPDSCLK